MSHEPNEIADTAQAELDAFFRQLLGLFREAAQEACTAAGKRKAGPSAKAGIGLKL